MIKPIKNREIRIFKVDPKKTLRKIKEFFKNKQFSTEQLQSDLNNQMDNQIETLDHQDPELKKAMFAASSV